MIDLNTPLRGLPLAVLDTETTGLDPATSHIVEVAVVHMELGVTAPRVVYSERVRPHLPGADGGDAWPRIDENGGAFRTNQISNADVADAPTWEHTWRSLAPTLEGRVVVAHNAPFDFRMVRAECGRFGIETPPWPWLDTQVPVKVVDKYERSKRLVDAATRRGIALDAHGAAGDAMTAALLAPGLWREAIRMTVVAGGATPETLGDLLLWQRQEALEQEGEFVAYLRGKGAKGARPDCHWHELEGEPLPYWPAPKAPTAPCPHCRRPVTTAIGKGGAIELRDANGVHDCDESRFEPGQHTTPPELP